MARQVRGQRGGADARTRILDAAMSLFAARGYDATPTKTIAEQAGVATGLVFYHFPTKRHLIDTLLAERSFVPLLRTLLSEADVTDPRGTVVTILRQLFAMLAERQEMVRIVVQASTGGAPGWDEFANLFQAEINATGDYLRQAIGPDRIDRRHARVMARALLSTGFFSTVVVPVDGNLDRFVQDLVDLVLRGYLD